MKSRTQFISKIKGGFKLLICAIFGIILFFPKVIKALVQPLIYQSEIFHVPRRNTNFVGRSKDLQVISQRLDEVNSPLLITGFSGIGKTQITKEFVHRYASDFKFVWWFNSSNSLHSQYVQLAKTWNKIAPNQESKIPSAALGGPNLINLVKDRLAQAKFDWLLVFDNIPDQEDFPQKYIPVSNSPNRRHYVLASSKHDLNWDNSVKINPMDRKDSLALIQKLISRETSKSDRVELATLLNDIPLALSRSASTISRIPSLSIPEFIRLSKAKNPTLRKLDEKLSPSQGFEDYKMTFRSVVNVGIKQLKKDSPISYECLLLIALIRSKDISLDLLKDWLTLRKVDAALLHEIVYNLTSKFFIEQSYDHNNEVFDIHELLQNTILEVSPKGDVEKAIRSAESLFIFYLSKSTWSVSERLSSSPVLFQHAKTLHEKQNALSFKRNIHLSVHLFHAAQYYAGDIEFALQILNELDQLYSKRKLNITKFEEARFLNTKSKVIFANNLNQAIECAEAASALLKTLKSDEITNEEQFLCEINNLVDYYLIQGRISDAKEVFKRFSDKIKDLNHEVYETLYFSFLALTQMYDGDNQRALISIDKAIKAIETGSLSESLFIFVFINKAEILSRLGKAKESLKLVSELQNNLNDIFGSSKNHLVIRASIIEAYALLLDKHTEKAKKVVLESIVDYSNLVKSEKKDPIQAFAHTIVGDIYRNFGDGDPNKALNEFKIAEDIYSTVLETKELDDISDLYTKAAKTAVDLKRIDLTREYFQKQIAEFGRSHLRSKEIINYLDLRGLPVPW